MIRVSKNRIRATGDDANGLLIALASDEQLIEWQKSGTGSERFRKMVEEAIAARAVGARDDDFTSPTCKSQRLDGEAAA